MSIINLAIIDKYPVVRIGIKIFLKNHFPEIVVFESDSISGFQDADPDIKPDLIILGVSQVNDLNNISILKSAKHNYPASKIILYVEASGTSNSGSDFEVKALIVSYLKIGIDGYLSKLNNLSELETCISDIRKGKHYICSDALFSMLLTENTGAERAVNKVYHQLSSRELEVAKFLSEGMPTKTIAQKLGRAPSTISTTKANIFKKLNIDNVIKLRDIIHLREPSQTFGNQKRS